MKLCLLHILVFITILHRSKGSPKSTFNALIQRTVRPFCLEVDTSKIGVIYIFLPNRFLSNRRQNASVFKQNHFYSLLLLSKIFKLNPRNRLLFYYVNDNGHPISNHYNRWITDEFWKTKIGLDNIQFIKINQESIDNNNRFDMYEIFSKIKEDSLKRFDSLKSKSHTIMVTNDVIVGPNILNCFAKDNIQSVSLSRTNDKPIQEANLLREKLTDECYKTLHSDKETSKYFSFLFTLNMIHHSRDFSGILIWRMNKKDHISENNEFKNQINTNLISSINAYKCHYKTDALSKDSSNNFSNAYCVYGYEINSQDLLNIEEIIFNNNYFSRLMRHYLYNQTDKIEYSILSKATIPNIVHLIWFSEYTHDLRFIEYLSIKSILKNLRPNKIRIHGDNKPSGNYWNELTGNEPNIIEWVHKKRELFKYGLNLTASPVQHLADIARLEVMYEEGGIYSDLDVLWVKSIDKLRFMNVELIAANDITSYCDEFPNNIQIGAFLASPKSQFVKKWLDGYRDKYHLYPGDYVAVSMCEPYKLYEQQPRVVLIENRLQMIYFNGWENFIPRYIDIPQENLSEFNQNLDWLNNGTFGYHLPRHGNLFTQTNFENADQNLLPIKIANFILNGYK